MNTKTQEVWIVTCEIVVQRGDLPSGNTDAFVNVVAWADSSSIAQQKAIHCLESNGWLVIGIEACRLADDRRIYEEHMAEIIDKVHANPEAVIYARMFSYKGD